ncbi:MULTISPECIES: NfeD family protein [Nocardiopsis]|jgi:membrane protein implicated in regulation of membrane protease activity|uniref:NfeD family protein n=2 Tax=Nocardiopsis alba TaxID=53437 RepID=A0A7K2IPC1_9ACTN|nr:MULTISPECIES: NfeD family protein [Nocardiopsis]AFR11131.1 nfeD-like partner-binding family protein [Nocardiopsis alba ATCC BAA-2165]MEC3894030.1 NfeD family protein [Nocardiopsis sp. LDBS1602]MYR31645.1 NfeD family protein [Nocardiopsis alba]
MPVWLIWIILATALGVAEFFTLTFVLGLLAAAALVAGLLGALGLPVVVQIIGFAAAAAAGLVLVKPLMDRQMNRGPDVRSGTAALVGRSAVVLEEVDADRGLVKLNGEEWSARCLDEDLVVPVGARVDVMEIDGATAVVYPREALPERPEPPEQNRPEQD